MQKCIALLLALVMAFGLVACSPSAKTEQGGETSSTIIPDGPYNGELPLVQEGEDNVVTIGILTSANVLDYDDNAYTLWLEEQTGVDIQFVQFAGQASDAATQISLMCASGEELPDILLFFSGISKSTGEQYGADGYFLDLKPYFEKYAYYFNQSFDMYFGEDSDVYNMVMNRAMGAEGEHIFAFPTVEDVPLDTPDVHTWINQQWLDTLGLTAPTTVDELYDVLVAFRDGDPNGNGIKDEIPMIGRANAGYQDIVTWVINAYIFLNDTYHFNITDGQFWSPYIADEYREALKFLNKLVSEGLLSSLTWTQTDSEITSLINPSDGVYKCGVIAGHADVHFEQGNDSIYVYEPLAPLADATGSGGWAPLTDYSNYYNTFITCDCDNPVLAFKLLDFMCSSEAYLRQRWGEYGVDWEYSEGGKPGNLGGEAKIRVLDSSAFTGQNSSCWHMVTSVASERYWEYEINENGTDWDSTRARKLLQNYQNCTQEGLQPEEVFTYNVYTDEETELRSEFVSDLHDYVKTSRANFCTGVLDPNSDSDWNTYVEGVKSQRFDEYLSIAQTAYERLNSN